MPANILDLRGVALEEIKVIDRTGKEWRLHDGLPLRTALTIMELAPAFESGQLDADQLMKTVRAVLVVFRRYQPDVTEEELLDAFDVADLVQIIVFLSTRSQGQAERAQDTEALMAEVEARETETETIRALPALPAKTRSRTR